jgi:hypothetical protein
VSSMVLGYVPGSGFCPLISGNPYSGTIVPTGGFQLRADRNNSGNIYVSLSGAFVFSGQVGCLPASGGPTITSGAMPLSGSSNSGRNDALQLGPGDSYFIPHIAIQNTGAYSGTYQICIGGDLSVSGLGRVYWDAF